MSVSEASREQETMSDSVLYADAIEYFETHDLSDDLKNRQEIQMEAASGATQKWYTLDAEVSEKLDSIAQRRGVPAETLLNEWVQEKTAEILTVGAAE